MKKIITLVLLSVMFTSCFSTRLVTDEPNLKGEFIGSDADVIEFEMGEPDRVVESNRGYDYIYTYSGDRYRRFAFNSSDKVIGVKSTTTVPVRKFSAGKTVGAIIVFGVVMPVVIGVAIGAVAAETR